MNLSPAQKKVIEIGDGAVTKLSRLWGERLYSLGLIEIWSCTLTPKGQQLYEDMKKK